MVWWHSFPMGQLQQPFQERAAGKPIWRAFLGEGFLSEGPWSWSVCISHPWLSHWKPSWQHHSPVWPRTEVLLWAENSPQGPRNMRGGRYNSALRAAVHPVANAGVLHSVRRMGGMSGEAISQPHAVHLASPRASWKVPGKWHWVLYSHLIHCESLLEDTCKLEYLG
jgi:hypothetical protein